VDKEEIRKIFSLLLVDHNPEEFFKYCTDDVKFILHPKHVAAGIYDKKSIFNLFEHLAKSFPYWSETIEKIYHDKEERVFITISKGQSSTIKDLWDVHFLYYNEDDKIYRIEERIDTLHLAEGNIGPKI
jgi:ketosteroid isomerase-like protein